MSPKRYLPLAIILAVAIGAGVWWFAGRGGVGDFGHEPSAQGAPALAVTYPLPGTLFPRDIAAPTFTWEDGAPESKAWSVAVECESDRRAVSAVVSEAKWTPREDEWERIKASSLKASARLEVAALRDRGAREALAAGETTFSTSPDSVGAPIFYREVILPFGEAVSDPGKIRWRFGTVDREEQPPIVLQDLPVCGNCHSFSADGKTLGLDVDYANDKGSYAIAPVEKNIPLSRERIISWSDYKRSEDERTFGLLSQISPDGRFVVSTVKDRSVFTVRDDLAFSQLFFPIKGLLVVYDRAKKTYTALKGADDKRYVQSNPCWSPDGKYIVFARADGRNYMDMKNPSSAIIAGEEAERLIKQAEGTKYDLCRVPFNGGKGGVPELLKGASSNGKSNYFPRYSPDGKWIVFCQAKQYMLLMPDSRLYIMPAGGGEAREMRCNTALMNSWHSWSPNGKWLVFSSKANTPYTQLMLTHIDENGMDTPPVLLDRFTSADRAANIPEFVNASGDAIARIREDFMDDLNYIRAGTDLFGGGHYEQAASAFRHAIEKAADNPVAHFCLGNALAAQGKYAEAQPAFAAAVKLEPTRDEYRYTMGRTLRKLERDVEAAAALREAVRLNPKHVLARAELGRTLSELGRREEGCAELARAVALAPKDVAIRYSYAAALKYAGRRPEAISEATAALELARAADNKAQIAEITRALEAFRTGAGTGAPEGLAGE